MMGGQRVGGCQEPDTQVIKDKGKGAGRQIKPLRDLLYDVQI